MRDSLMRLNVFRIISGIARFADRILEARIPHRAAVDLWEPDRKRTWR
jgi:hypothetical protein